MIPACRKMGVMKLEDKVHQLTRVADSNSKIAPEPLVGLLAMETSKPTNFFKTANLIWWIGGVVHT